VDNRTGAGGTIGASVAAKSPPDGYILFQASSAIASSGLLYKNLPYDMTRDFSAVTLLASSPLVVVVHPSLPVKSIKELVELAKAKPGQVNCGSVGTGTSSYVTAELFKSAANIDLLNVAYKGGGPALLAVVAGETSVYFAPLASSLPMIRNGRLRALAVTTAKRVPLLPEYPTIAESGYPGFNAGNWYALMVPAKTPAAIITKIYDAAVSTLHSQRVSKRLADLGYVSGGDRPEQTAANIKSEIAKLARIFQERGLVPQ
jgi:tripartite-type tricarboxylate transporter receptor subunit TctC